jgi:hypothetical protein
MNDAASAELCEAIEQALKLAEEEDNLLVAALLEQARNAARCPE